MHSRSAFLILVLSTVLLFGCKKTSNENDPVGVFFKVNGVAKSYPTATAERSYYPTFGNLTITAGFFDVNELNFNIKNPAAGTITFPNDTVLVDYGNSTKGYRARSGKMVITELTTTTVTGTFAFTGVDGLDESVAITEGRFHCILIVSGK